MLQEFEMSQKNQKMQLHTIIKRTSGTERKTEPCRKTNALLCRCWVQRKSNLNMKFYFYKVHKIPTSVLTNSIAFIFFSFKFN